MKALFWDKEKSKCMLCPHRCMIANGKRGICHVRENQEGTLISLNYGKIVAASVDPIEKKPFYNFLPGSKSYSIATVGCNFKCSFCQNWEISQSEIILGKDMTPEDVVSNTIKEGCESIAYTYTEPTIFFEFSLAVSKLAKKKGLKNVFITNGYTSPDAIKVIAPFLNAANIDLKSFSDDFYKKECNGRLQPVLDSIKLYHKLGIHVELTTLIIPSLNDSEENFSQIAKFIASVDKNIVWHISRFFPHYKKNDIGATPIKILEIAKKIGEKAGLRNVYLGNV